MVVETFGEGNEVGGIDEGKLVDLYADPACAASIVVDLGYDLSEGSHSCRRILRYSIGFGVYRKVRGQRDEILGMVGEIASDQGLANFPALTWDGEQGPKVGAEFRVIEVFAKGFDGGLSGIPLLVERWSAGLGNERPEAVTRKEMKRVLNSWLIVALPDKFEVVLETGNEFIRIMNAVIAKTPGFDQVEDSEEQDRLVRSFVGILLVSLEIVKKDESFLDGHHSSRR